MIEKQNNQELIARLKRISIASPLDNRKIALIAIAADRIDALETELARLRDPNTCKWRCDGDYLWETTCGLAFFFEEGDTEDNDFNYCPKCGRRLEDTTP